MSKHSLRLLLAAFLAAVTTTASAGLPHSTPEEQGIPSEAILKILQAAEADPYKALHGLVIVRHGHVVTEAHWAPYAANQPHELFSLSKSFTSTAVGLAQSEGLLSIDDLVLRFFPEASRFSFISAVCYFVQS